MLESGWSTKISLACDLHTCVVPSTNQHQYYLLVHTSFLFTGQVRARIQLTRAMGIINRAVADSRYPFLSFPFFSPHHCSSNNSLCSCSSDPFWEAHAVRLQQRACRLQPGSRGVRDYSISECSIGDPYRTESVRKQE